MLEKVVVDDPAGLALAIDSYELDLLPDAELAIIPSIGVIRLNHQTLSKNLLQFSCKLRLS